MSKNLGKTTPMVIMIEYARYICYLFPWFACILGLTPEEFKGQCGSQSDRIEFASADSNANIPVEPWGQHGDWASFKGKKMHET